MKTLCQYPGLIGEVLARAERRAKRRGWLRRLLGLDRKPRVHHARLGEKELVISCR